MSGELCTALELSRYVVGKCARDERPVSNLQLQKILYFLQSVYCKATGGSLLFGDEFEAWPYGPVVKAVYDEFSRFGGYVIDDCRGILSPGFEGEQRRFVDSGIEQLRSKAPWDLVRISHAPGSPWDRVFEGGAGYKRTIPNELIIEAATKGGSDE